jgi:hypothetical protein
MALTRNVGTCTASTALVLALANWHMVDVEALILKSAHSNTASTTTSNSSWMALNLCVAKKDDAVELRAYSGERINTSLQHNNTGTLTNDGGDWGWIRDTKRSTQVRMKLDHVVLASRLPRLDEVHLSDGFGGKFVQSMEDYKKDQNARKQEAKLEEDKTGAQHTSKIIDGRFCVAQGKVIFTAGTGNDLTLDESTNSNPVEKTETQKFCDTIRNEVEKQVEKQKSVKAQNRKDRKEATIQHVLAFPQKIVAAGRAATGAVTGFFTGLNSELESIRKASEANEEKRREKRKERCDDLVEKRKQKKQKKNKRDVGEGCSPMVPGPHETLSNRR